MGILSPKVTSTCHVIGIIEDRAVPRNRDPVGVFNHLVWMTGLSSKDGLDQQGLDWIIPAQQLIPIVVLTQ